MTYRKALISATVLTLLASLLIACASSNPNNFRYLISIAVTPTTADAQTFPNGQVQFTATGTFNQPPITGPVSSAAPYSGQFSVINPVTPPATIATIVSTGTGTATVQCVTGASGTVPISITASANNGTSTVVSGGARLTCP